MGIFINGTKIGNCNNVVIVNGRIMSGLTSGNSQKFDEKKSVRTDNVHRITVKCNVADVIMTAKNTDVIEAHFHGDAVVGDTPTFNISKNGREVIVMLNIDGSIMGNLALNVNIPTRVFELLNITSHNGNISVKEGVSAETIQLDTHNGDVESDSNFTKLYAVTHNGDVDISINAKSDVGIEASSHNGNVSVELQNIATNNIYTSTYNGNTKNRFRGKNGEYTANGQAKSYNGNVTVK